MIITRRDSMKAVVTLAAIGVIGAGQGCNSATWLANIQKFLPVLLQVGLNVAQIVGAANHTGQVDPTLSTEIRAILDEVHNDLTLLQSLINEYAQSAMSGTFAKIESTLALIQRNLQAVLVAFHIKDLTLQTLVATSIGAALTTIMGILALMPAPTPKQIAAATAKGTYTTLPSSRGRVMAQSAKPEHVLLAVSQEAFAQGGQTFKQ